MAGDTLKLTCKVNRVTLNIKWNKNGASDIPRAQIGPRIGDEITLYIEKVVQDDSGVYSCEAYNMAGAVSSTVRITVRGKPYGRCRSPELLNLKLDGNMGNVEPIQRTLYINVKEKLKIIFEGGLRTVVNIKTMYNTVHVAWCTKRKKENSATQSRLKQYIKQF